MTNNARLSALLAAAVAGVAAFWGGWTRRWMSDDGLIVLRTVRNILAGNGPVFNAGERVEANTSTLWQYLIAACAWLTGARLEDVAMWLALVCTVAAACVSTFASGRYWFTKGGAHYVVPFGILIYLALPPARDFATSGLEWGLSLLWIAVWWALLVAWAAPDRPTRHGVPPVGYLLAFWCGLSWLVRPELALYGGVTGIMLIAYAPRKTGGILAAALPVPAAYELFRMGYYGLLTPHTAVAKSASGAEWGSGFEYLWDFAGYYWLWLPLLGAVALGWWLLVGTRGRRLAIALVVVGCALAHIVYVLRVGGDFMHGRMWLLPLFALLLPVMAVPASRASVALTAAVAVWGGVTIVRAHPIDWEAYQTGEKELGIVDEREFWTLALGRELGDPPRHAEDFLGSKLMQNWEDALQDGIDADAAQLNLAYVSADPEIYKWFYRDRVDAETDLNNLGLTAYLINLGMTSMNAPLDVRVLDTVGLATPIAARMPRIPGGRIGHDKQLDPAWQAADSGTDLDRLPAFINPLRAKQARAALRTPEIAELLATSREPMSWQRFWANVRYSVGKGRTLTLHDDPGAYLDPATRKAIRRGEDPGESGTQIAWPVTVKTANDPSE